MPTPDLALVGAQDHARRARRASPRRRSSSRMQRPQQGDRRAQGQRAARLRRAVPRMRARGRSALSARSTYEEKIVDAMAALLVRDASHVRRRSSPPTCSATSCPTRPRRLPAASGSPRRSTPATEHAMAQAQHGSAPDIAGKDKANPASLIGSAAMLLAWLGERRDDARSTRGRRAIERALDRVDRRSRSRAPPISAARSAPRRSASGWRRQWPNRIRNY